MREVVYHVATSLDGFIARADGSIDGFPGEGLHVQEYLAQLQDYDTVIMGRRTYEFGYQFGLQPGARAYPHMRHLIFSRTLRLPSGSEVEVISGDVCETVRALKTGEGGPIYLCGGGVLASALLQQNLISRIRLKLCPVAFGQGKGLFGYVEGLRQFRLDAMKRYDSDVLLLDYRHADADR